MTKQTNMFEIAVAGLCEVVGCGVCHRGEHGTIVSFLPDTYAEPMFVVDFNGRKAVLKPSEIGAR